MLLKGRADLAQQLHQRVAQEAGVGWFWVESVGGRPETVNITITVSQEDSMPSNPEVHMLLFLNKKCVYRLVEVESTCGSSDADVPLLYGHDAQVHEIAVHLPVARWGVPATHSEDLQALQRLNRQQMFL